MNRRKVWTAVSTAALVVCLAAGGYAVHYKLNEIQGKNAYDELKETVKEPTAEDKEISNEDQNKENQTQKDQTEQDQTKADSTIQKNSPINKKSSEDSAQAKAKENASSSAKKKGTITPTPVLLDIPIDFKTLQEENQDIYAWITVPGTVIDYPVLQNSRDDSYYIHRDVDGNYLYAGAIYSEMQNKKDFSDFNTVLYGHNMADGSMFAGLHKFKDRDFFDEQREILVYTPDHIRHYEIFAAYTFDDRHLLNTFDFGDEKIRRKYLEEVFDLRTMDAFFKEGLKVTQKDKLLTLSTCVGNAPSSRYLVQGVLTEVE